MRDRILSNLPILSVPWRGTLDSPMIKSCWAAIISAHFHGAVNLPRSQWTKHAPLFAHVYWLVIRKSTSTPAWLVPMTPSLDFDERAVADRAAVLCETAENAFRELAPNSPPLLYVVGTEVPAPGGESSSEQSISVTAAGRVQCTLDAFKRAFDKHRLEHAWERGIGLVVQPGVDFGECI